MSASAICGDVWKNMWVNSYYILRQLCTCEGDSELVQNTVCHAKHRERSTVI